MTYQFPNDYDHDDLIDPTEGAAIREGILNKAPCKCGHAWDLDVNECTCLTVTGECDCGRIYNAGSRVDHDADTGQCWSCSDRNPSTMTDTEWDAYILGE